MTIFGQKLKPYELITLAILIFLILAIPLSVYLVKKQQIYKSKAAGNSAGKIGVQIVCNYPNQAEFESLIAQQPRVIKLMDDFSCAGRIKEISPSTFIVGRTYDGNFDDKYINDVIGGDPIGKAAEYVSGKEGAIRGNPNIDCWEGPNEPGTVGSNEAMTNYARFEAERVRRLAGMGARACIGNFGVGHPDLEEWPLFVEAIGAAKENGGYLAVHEYGAPGMQCMLEGDTGWLTLRYRKAYRGYLQPNGLEIPLLITETGVDGGVCGSCGCSSGRGWRTVTDATSYAGELQWYKSKLDEDGYVVGATIFASGLPSWSDFDPYPEIIGPQGLLISYGGTAPPPPGSSAAPSSCNIGYQSPDMGDGCSACLAGKDTNLVGSIRNLNVSKFGRCSSLELLNYWCNGGIGAQATNDCNSIKSRCGQNCGSSASTPPSIPPSISPSASPASTASIEGKVWEDLDGDRTINGSEVPLEGFKVYLDSGLTFQATNSQGYYTFSQVRSGSHLVFLDLNGLDSGNWILTTPSSVSVAVTAGSKGQAAFGLRHPLSDSSPTPTPTPTPSPSASPSPSPTPKITPSPTPRRSPTPTPTPSSVPSPSPSPTLPASQVKYDLNRDNRVNSVDRGLFLINWRSGDNFPVAEFNGDGVINSIDYALLVRNFSL